MEKNYKLIKGVEITPLKKLNEGHELKNPDKYVFQGVFTQCSTPEHKIVNRNGRIYQEKEVLRHLGYLREMIKENNGRILGELDHPEGRFDVQMKEASHAITDLWYDDKTKCVMGRLEVLDTPNGKTLKSIIDAGFPLYVSSRAAGDVDERTKEVQIAQIFTYDVVCTPGFKEARLERVDESLNLSDKALKYMNESISTLDDANMHDVEVPASAINESIVDFKVESIKALCNPLLESEEGEEKEERKDKKVKVIKKVKKEETKDVENKAEDSEEKEEKKTDECDGKECDSKEVLNDIKDFYPVMGANEVNEEDDKEESEETSEEDGSKEENTESSEEETSEEDGSKEEKEELSDEEKEKNRKLILDVKGLDDEGEELSGDEDESDKSEDIEDIEGKAEDDSEEDKSSEEETSEESDDEEDSEENEAKESKCVEQCEKKDKIKKETDDNIDELNSILASVEKSEAIKESIVRRYPFAISLSESNFAKFASLRPKLKKRCADFIEENQIYDICSINELWTTPLREDKKLQENWLKLASQEDIDLYVAAPLEVQNAIEESAKLWVLESKEDVENFWESTGLRQAAYKKAMNEKFIKDYQNVMSESQIADRFKLGYDINIINTMDQWYND